jgi:agmatine/peptidylarginine deiminase
VGWDPTLASFYRELLGAAQREASISILVDPDVHDPGAVHSLVDALWEESSGADKSIGIIETAIDSIWLRDFGPLVGTNGNERWVVDLQYWGKGADDTVATTLASDELGLVAYDVPLVLEGGNLLSDGQGHCLLSTEVLVFNRSLGEEAIRQLLLEYFGCTETLFLPPLPNEETKHVDMYATFTAPGEVIVGRFEAGTDPAGEMVLDFVAQELDARGFLVRRVPMPYQGDGIARSYTNALALNDAVLIPEYPGVPGDLQEALRVFAEAYPDRRLVTIESEDIIKLDGAIHCATMTLPR